MDDLLALSIFTFSKVSMSNFAFSIDEVFCWPVLIRVRIPERKIIVENDWICYTSIFHSLFDVGSLLLKGKLWSMDSDDDESLISVFLVPSSHIGESSLTVDT